MARAKYEKPADLRSEWEALGDPAALGFVDALASARMETIVTARRTLAGRIPIDRIDETLIDRSAPLINAAARRVAAGAPDMYREEIEEEIVEAFWRDVLGGESFYEIRFALTLRNAARDARRKVLGGKQRQRERKSARVVFGETDELSLGVFQSESELASHDDLSSDVVDRFTVQAILDELPDDVARAMTLHVIMDLKIASMDPREATVATVMGCSERKARGLIAEGRATISTMIDPRAEGQV
jgi:DNA-directed RNA polymerase specialized sigma24 family protein